MPTRMSTTAMPEAGDVSDENLTGSERMTVGASARRAGNPLAGSGLHKFAEHDYNRVCPLTGGERLLLFDERLHVPGPGPVPVGVRFPLRTDRTDRTLCGDEQIHSVGVQHAVLGGRLQTSTLILRALFPPLAQMLFGEHISSLTWSLLASRSMGWRSDSRTDAVPCISATVTTPDEHLPAPIRARRSCRFSAMLQWEEVDPYATWPEERFRAVGDKHDYRIIILDPKGEHIIFPGHKTGVDWWALVVREIGEDGVFHHLHYGAHLTVEAAKRDAEQWEGQPASG